MPNKMAHDAAFLCRLFARILTPRGAKLAISSPTWRRDVPKMANGEPKMGNLASFWAHLGDAFLVLGRDLCKTSENQKKRRVVIKLGGWILRGKDCTR